jgi:hypothetical protein
MMADFYLDDLPIPDSVTQMMSSWHQFRGDPAIRGSLFSQQRSNSYLDIHIDHVHELIQQLLRNYGVFHVKMHYSSSRVTLWLYEKPHHYLLHDVKDILDGSVFSYYQEYPYPADASVSAQQLDTVLIQFRELRFADENMYLRSASINIINGIVGLNFSCDGSHYIPASEFIDNSMEYWLGTLKTA